MTAPVTRLIREFSDPEATVTGWQETREILEKAELFWISTVRTDGRPHVTPVVAVWLDGTIWFSTGEGEQKFANLRTNPRVVLTTGCNRWEQGLDVVVEGEAVLVTEDATLSRVAAAFASRWDGGGSGSLATVPSAAMTGAAARWCSASRRSRCSLTPKATRLVKHGTDSDRATGSPSRLKPYQERSGAAAASRASACSDACRASRSVTGVVAITSSAPVISTSSASRRSTVSGEPIACAAST